MSDKTTKICAKCYSDVNANLEQRGIILEANKIVQQPLIATISRRRATVADPVAYISLLDSDDDMEINAQQLLVRRKSVLVLNQSLQPSVVEGLGGSDKIRDSNATTAEW